MKTFTTSNIKRAAKVKDGEEYLFTFTDCGHRYEMINVNYEGHQYTKTYSRYSDVKTGADLDTYLCEEEDFQAYLVRNLDGTLECDILY